MLALHRVICQEIYRSLQYLHSFVMKLLQSSRFWLNMKKIIFSAGCVNASSRLSRVLATYDLCSVSCQRFSIDNIHVQRKVGEACARKWKQDTARARDMTRTIDQKNQFPQFRSEPIQGTAWLATMISKPLLSKWWLLRIWSLYLCR